MIKEIPNNINIDGSDEVMKSCQSIDIFSYIGDPIIFEVITQLFQSPTAIEEFLENFKNNHQGSVEIIKKLDDLYSKEIIDYIHHNSKIIIELTETGKRITSLIHYFEAWGKSDYL